MIYIEKHPKMHDNYSMTTKYNRRAIDKIKFSIGKKLIVIISIIVIFSLGTITALASWLIREDLTISAEDNNMEINRRSAMEAETAINNIRSNSRLLIQTVTDPHSNSEFSARAVNNFFKENPQVPALFFIMPGKDEQIYINKNYLTSKNINESLVNEYFKNKREAMGRALRGETLLLNATPHFNTAVLALFFPSINNGVGVVLFSSENMNNNFGFGANQSYMINADGDLLVHSDSSLIIQDLNIAGEEYIQNILLSTETHRQQLIESEFNFMKLQKQQSTDLFSGTWNNARQFLDKLDNIIDEKIKMLNVDIKIDNKEKKVNNEDKKEKFRQFIAYTKLSSPGVVVLTGIEYEKVYEGINATTRRNIYLTIAILSISIIFIWFFAKTISIPLKGLAQAARKIEGGIFRFDMQKRKANDEIGVLMGSFQKMCTALNIFGKFTNKEIAVKAMKGQIKPGGLPKHATIFFSDIRNFTAMSENFTKVYGQDASDRIVAWLNAYFTQMIDCVEKTTGTIDKFIGDAVMAHWGTATTAGSPQRDAFNCIKAALMMRKALYYLNKSRKANDPGDPVINIGCGINTGIVTAGQLGSDMRMEYTVIGDPVNLASRIEALTKPLGADILISEYTYKLIGSKFITEEMPSVTVKGKEKPVRIFAVVNFKGERKGPQSLADVRKLLKITPPDINKVDINADEKKYKIGE